MNAKEAREARKRALAFEANMAVEGIELDAESRRVADYIDSKGLSVEEGRKLITEDLRRRGIIPDDPTNPAIAAE